MTEFGRGHSGGRENNYNYTNSLQNIIYLLMQGATQPPQSRKDIFGKKYTPYYLAKMSK